MNSEKPNQPTEEELQVFLKEDYIRSSGAMLMGETVADYRKRKEEEWDRMHPKKETAEVTELVVAESESTPNEEVEEEERKRAEASEVKRQADLKMVRQELGLDTSPEKPKRNYVEVVIDDDYMRKNLIPNKGLRMKGGEANYQTGEVNLMRYVISKDLSPEYRQIVTAKIEKQKTKEEKLYQHESHHIHNWKDELAPYLAAKNLREYLAFRLFDEMSAFTTGELDSQDMTAENILEALRTAEKHITDSYYGEPFSDDASWYMSQHGNEPEALSRKIDQERYHKIMRHYFKINGQNVLSVLQKDNRMSEFTEITNRLIIKLDPILETKKATEGQKANSGMESTGKTEGVENKEKSDKEAELVSLEERKKLNNWDSGYELAKIAKQEGLDLASLSREEYAEYAIKNSLAIDDAQLRMAPWQRNGTSVEELLVGRKKARAEVRKETAEAFDKFFLEMKTRAGQQEQDRYLSEKIRVRSGTKDSDSWLFFGINDSLDGNRPETYKSYASVKDLNTLTPERFISFLKALRDGGYHGDVKTFQDIIQQGTGLNDQIVMHGRSEEDSKLALEIAERFFAEDLDKKGIGKDEMIDGKEYSYSQILARKIKAEIERKN